MLFKCTEAVLLELGQCRATNSTTPLFEELLKNPANTTIIEKCEFLVKIYFELEDCKADSGAAQERVNAGGGILASRKLTKALEHEYEVTMSYEHTIYDIYSYISSDVNVLLHIEVIDND